MKKQKQYFRILSAHRFVKNFIVQKLVNETWCFVGAYWTIWGARRRVNQALNKPTELEWIEG